MTLTIEIGNTSTARMTGVKSSVTGVIDDEATLSITLYDKAGAQVTGQPWPAQMYNTGSGEYGATLLATLDLSLNHIYTAEVNGLGSNGEVLYLRQPVQAVNRGGAC